jgi:RimJ/RimL family protein N-acetyltransferase
MHIRDAKPADIPHILRLEHLHEFHTLIGTWTEAKHAKTLADADSAYLVVEDDEQEVVGYAILLGVSSPDKSIELKRVVISAPGQGHGKELLHFIADRVFNQYRAHRLFLDVYETNSRARHVYATFGFSVDGVLREAAFRDGHFHSLILMSILDREYHARHTNIA